MVDSTWQFVRGWAHRLRLGYRLGSLAWAKRLVQAGLTSGNFHVDGEGRLALDDLGVSIEPGPHEVLVDGYALALAAHRAGVRFSIEEGQLQARAGGVCALVKTYDDLFILHEIYAENSYGISGAGELLIFDVGMNVGHASLYFASRFPDAVVFAFEPFRNTFERALANFEQNPAIASRIHPFNYGLAAADATMEVEFDPVVPGRMGLFGIPADVSASSGRRRERVAVKDVLDVFDEATVAHPNRVVYMKVDCEGAEYEILTRLHQSNRLKDVQMLAIEWHRKTAEQDPARLEAMLCDAGFKVICSGAQSAEAGMMYAVNVGVKVREPVPCPA
jgi:FkbM family methyltransferase